MMMFYPQEMTEIELIVPTRDVLAVTKLLSGRGIFHQIDSTFLSSKKDAPLTNPWQEEATAYAAVERRIQASLSALNLSEGQPPKTDLEAMVQLDAVRPTIDTIEREVKQITDQLTNDHKKLEQNESTIRQLEPVVDIDLDLASIKQGRYLFTMLGNLPTANIQRIQTSLDRVPFVFTTLRHGTENSVVWLAGSQKNADVLERAARSAYLNPLSLPEGHQGTPGEVIAQLKVNNEQVQQHIDEQKTILKQLGDKHQQQLQSLLWDVRASRLLTDAIVRFGQLRYTYIIVGWVPQDVVESLKNSIKQTSKEAIFESFPPKRSGNRQDIPVALKHPSFLRPFQMLVTTYGRPRYNEIDPTWIMAVMFPLLFGAMFGDVGQGLVLAVLGWLVGSRKVKALRGLASLGGVVMACGLVATVFGFLYGSVFGFEALPALWMRPINNILTILMIAIGAGVVLLTLAFTLGIINAWLAKDWGKFFFDNHGLAGLLLYWSLLGLVGGIFLGKLPVPSIVFVILAIISGTAVMLSELFKHLVSGHRPLIEGGIGTYAIQAFFELFETVISFMSNSLSYVRVGAFAVAHGGLSAAVFILAEIVSPTKGLGYVIVVLGGNIFILGLEGLIVGIQTMRLSYYEFFGKFFTGGGAPFEPLTLRPNENK
jgi:V/A-type H+-transporting ATPase subunit I